MGTTPIYSLPYPEGSDPPQGHTAIAALAAAVESALEGLASPVCLVHKSSDQTIDELTVTLLTGWQQQINAGGFVVASSGVTVPDDGVYVLGGSVAIDGGAVEKHRSVSWIGRHPFASQSFAVDYSRTMAQYFPFTTGSVQGQTTTHMTIAQLSAGDELGMAAYMDVANTSTATRAVRGGYETQLAVVKVA